MALDQKAALRLPNGTGPVLTLVPSPAVDIWQSEEADIEAIAFMDETAAAMDELIGAEMHRDIPSALVLTLAGRVAWKAALAKAEVLRLRGGGSVA